MFWQTFSQVIINKVHCAVSCATQYRPTFHTERDLCIILGPLHRLYNNYVLINRMFTRFSKRPANFQQTSSISTCILNTFAGSLLNVCWIV